MPRPTDLTAFAAYARALAGLTSERIETMRALAAEVEPYLEGVTDRFYARLESVPETRAWIDGRVESLRKPHRDWLTLLFRTDFGAGYAQTLTRIGDAHAKAGLPVDFLIAGMTVVQEALQPVVLAGARAKPFAEAARLASVNAALGCSLVMLQRAYATRAATPSPPRAA